MSFNPILKRVLIYNPNPLLAESLCNGLELCGPFTTKACSRGLMETLVEFRPNIVVLDPGHLPVAPELWRAEVERQLPGCEALAYVDMDDRGAALRCLAAGFVGAVSQGRGIEALVEAVTAANLGGIYVDQSFAPGAPALRTATEIAEGEGPGQLSDRERYVLEHVARGFSNKEIAGKLGLSAKTVETYRSRASGKLGLRRKSDIVQFALRNDWLAERPYAL